MRVETKPKKMYLSFCECDKHPFNDYEKKLCEIKTLNNNKGLQALSENDLFLLFNDLMDDYNLKIKRKYNKILYANSEIDRCRLIYKKMDYVLTELIKQISKKDKIIGYQIA